MNFQLEKALYGGFNFGKSNYVLIIFKCKITLF